MHIARLLILVALHAVAGCSLFAESPVEPSPWDGLTTAPVAPVEPPDARRAPQDCPTLEELRALLGEPTQAPAVVAMKARLGEAEPRQDDVGRLRWEDYPRHGLSLGIDDSGHVEVVALLRGDGSASGSFCGALPMGLDFGASEKGVEAALGPPEYRAVGFGDAEHGWVAKGFRVVFRLARKGGMKSLYLVRPVPLQATRIWNVGVRSDRVVRGLRSLEISFDYAVNLGRHESRFQDSLRNAVFFRVTVLDAEGAPLRRRGPKTYRGAEAVARHAYRAPITHHGRTTIAVPYYLVDLPSGRHDVGLDLTADLLVDGEREDTALKRQAIPAMAIEMPEVRWVSLGVDAIEVVDAVYDSFAFGENIKPDIFWRLSYPTGERIYTSPIRPNRLRARFGERSPYFPVVDGDELHLEVLDNDPSPESLGWFSPTLDEIEAGKPHSSGRVTSLSFARLRDRPH